MCKMLFYFFVFVFGGLNSSLVAQETLTKKEKKALTKTEAFSVLVDSVEHGSLYFVADRALPTGYRSVTLTSNPNFVSFQKDLVKGDLPFFGRAFHTTPGVDGGIAFNSKPENTKIDVNDGKQKIVITFEAKGDQSNPSPYEFMKQFSKPGDNWAELVVELDES